jgi:hypothetical protein
MWVTCSLGEQRGSFPMHVKDELQQRCPGFLEEELDRTRECLKTGVRYSFMSEFIPSLVGSGFREVLSGRPTPIDSLLEDPRLSALHRYLGQLDKDGAQGRWFSGAKKYPTYQEWRCAVCGLVH